ncbi:hypothetical protein ETAA8_19820 [Anatilimnocola aggregata]|uniref:Squalene cyclase C-terminal domain-containing protein n=1 Tax=Anatilimnocola aggregata TaxID=2528021 RepID=A0A517Y9I9_9BACT|nr:prenyltransferase/squalene oxidase repeat-containing protein [Anatilimnocola aggregata]QDU26898.1 hypothetical protein ETAA8_19820 [Anatilimnocola aggregata]
MAKFDPFRQDPQPGPGYPPPPAPFPVPPGAPGHVPPPAYGQNYGQPAYGQQYAAPQPPYPPTPYAQPGYPQPGYQQPNFPPQPGYPNPPQAAYYAQPTAVPGYGQPSYPPNPYAPPPPAAVPAYPTNYAPQAVPVAAPVPASPPDLPMSARAVPVPPAMPTPVPVRPVQAVAVQPAAVQAPVAPRPVQPQPVPARPVAAATTAAPVAPAANRPVPAASAVRPVLAPVKPKDDKPKVDKDAAADKPPGDPTEKVIKGAPPWMISLVVHMVMLIILALLVIPIHFKNQIFIESEPVFAEKLGEQIIDDQLQSPESLNMEIENPVLSFDTKPADDPLAAPPILEMTSVDATDSVDVIEAPSIGMALNGREAGSKKALLAAYGGNATTEESVRKALMWLKKNQKQDGSWSLVGPFSDPAGVENRVSATAMALLAFQGAGNTHKQGDFKKEVENGWKALKAMQNADGYFECDAAHHHRLYAQAQASIAACEIYGMTKDEQFKPVAQKAIDFAIRAQAPEGGWRYEPKIDSDTSVTGWYVMALQSGMMAGLEVPSPNVGLINEFLDRVQTNGGSHYMYKPGMEQTLTMTAEGLLCRQYLGWKHDDPRMIAGLDYVVANKIDYNDANVYYWYYATQAAHHMGGSHWKQWNQVMIQTVPSAQIKTGNETGSWSPSGDRWGSHGGRLYVTCLSTFMLEAYYRHMPLYKHKIETLK